MMMMMMMVTNLCERDGGRTDVSGEEDYNSHGHLASEKFAIG
jgi:hypothetical protein